MTSSDFKERFKAEYRIIENYYEKNKQKFGG